MTALLPTRERRPPPMDAPDPARTLDTLATILITVLTIAILYFAREILVPIAIAILFSFALSPLVKALRRTGVNKKIAVILVVVLTFTIAVALGAVLGKQISDLAAEAPRYQVTVTAKIDRLRELATANPLLTKLNGMIADVSHIAPAQPKEPPKAPAGRGTQTLAPDRSGAPVPVEVVKPAPGVLTILQGVASTAASPLATAAFVAILIVFMLMQREDLRNRFIRLVGFGDLQRTTMAMTDAAERLSRYLLAQVLLNVSFGVVAGCVVAIIGIPAAVMWGIIAAIMRFIPYIGTIGAALGPVVLGAVTGAGWSMAIETAVFFIALEALVGQVVEPLVYGHHTGMSPIAIVASATFWTWLWGPVGLVMATPLTVCLVVMGRHVERFAFLDVLLGDAPALSPVESFYQRMLAGDASEVADHAEDYLRERSLLDYCNDVALPTLLLAQADVRRGALAESRQLRIRDSMQELIEDLSDEHAFAPPDPDETAHPPAALEDGAEGGETQVSAMDMLPTGDIDAAWRQPGAVLCVAGRTPLDEAAARLLVDLLARRGVGCQVVPIGSDLGADVSGAKLVILSFLDADLRIAQARFAVRRLRRRVPGVPVVAAFWMSEADETRTTGLCADVRADVCVSTLPQALAFCLERAVAAPVETPPLQAEADDTADIGREPLPDAEPKETLKA